MGIRSHYKGLYAAGGIMIALLVMVIAIAAQSQTKVLRKRSTNEVSIDSILPDTTKAKIDLVNSIATMAEKSVQRDSIALVKEAQETAAMRKNSDALESLVKKKENEPIRPKSVQLTTNVIKYPDTLTIVIKSEKKGVFKRRKE